MSGHCSKPCFHLHRRNELSAGDASSREDVERCCNCGQWRTTEYRMGALPGHGAYGPVGWIVVPRDGSEHP